MCPYRPTGWVWELLSFGLGRFRSRDLGSVNGMPFCETGMGFLWAFCGLFLEPNGHLTAISPPFAGNQVLGLATLLIQATCVNGIAGTCPRAPLSP